MKFTPDDILTILEDEGYDCDWILTSDSITNVDKRRKELGIRVTVSLNNNTALELENVLPYLEEVIDRFESEGYFFNHVQTGIDVTLHNLSFGVSNKSKKYTNLDDIKNKTSTNLSDTLIIQFEKDKREEPKTRFQKVKSFLGFNESLILEAVKFNKQPKNKGAKTDVYNVVNGGTIIGQVKWSSRMRGYGFLPTKDCEKEVKEFASELMKKWRAERKKNKPKKSKD